MWSENVAADTIRHVRTKGSATKAFPQGLKDSIVGEGFQPSLKVMGLSVTNCL